MKLPIFALIGLYNALSLSDELKALVNFDQWEKTSGENRQVSGKVSKTADEAERLRLMRTDLLHLLDALPEKEKPSDNGIVLNAKLSDEDEEGSSASGDWDIDLGQLLNDNENSRDIALMVRHGLLDDMIDTTHVEMGTNPVDSASSAVFLAPESDKDFSDAEKANPETNESEVPVASLDDMPTFDKLVMSHRNPRKPTLVTGENRNGNAGKSQWLTLSVVGSLAAIVLTVTLTVFARRIKSGKNANSGTPVQKLRRFNLKHSPLNAAAQNPMPRRVPAQQFAGYNAAYRPQSMDSGLHDYSTNSSQVSASSGSFPPQQAPRQPRNGQVVNFAPRDAVSQGTHAGYPNRNRALPPPPYSRIQY